MSMRRRDDHVEKLEAQLDKASLHFHPK